MISDLKWRGEKISHLVLGTVQLGMDYGISNSQGKPSDEGARELVHHAWTGGIHIFDTAQAYGDSETVLGKALISLGISDSAKVISKLSPALSPNDFPAITASIEESMKRLGVSQLWGLMLHRSEWLDSWKNGLGDLLEGMKRKGTVKHLGVSVYDPDEAMRALQNDGIDIVQVPCNAWDRGMIIAGVFEAAAKLDKLCFVRSIYLQGLLLMSPDEVQKKLPAAYQASMKWCSIAREHGYSKAEFAAKFAKTLGLPLVIGMETPEQVKENLKLFSARALGQKTSHKLQTALAPLLSDEIVNPSKWKTKGHPIKAKKKVLAIIQARMGSSRLPGKMALPVIHGKGALELMIERVTGSRMIDKLVVATTVHPSDGKLFDLCAKLKIPCFRGSEEDVLDRFYKTYKNTEEDFDVIVRLTGDCQLHDPVVIDKVISAFLESGSDYVSNVDPPTYPDGLDTEVFSSKALERSWKEAKMKSEREHVTLYMRNSGLFKKLNVVNDTDLSACRWTLDEESDYRMIKAVYEGLYDRKRDFRMSDVLEFLSCHPEIENLNRKIARNEGLKKSLNDDKKVKP